MKHGLGEERTLVGAIFVGTSERTGNMVRSKEKGV